MTAWKSSPSSSRSAFAIPTDTPPTGVITLNCTPYGVQFNVMTPVGGVSVGIANALREEEGDDFQAVIFRLGGNF